MAFQPDRTITAKGLSALLARLDSDADRAAAEFERLRRALIRFFGWRGAASPDECGDEVLDRLARKLEQGVVIDDVSSYTMGMARLVLLERRRAPAAVALDQLGNLPHAPDTNPSDDDERGLQACFERCLDELPSDGRALVMQYYEGERRTKIANRRRLAATLGLSDNALRSRVQRLRDRLEQCVRTCMAGRSGSTR